MLAFFTKAIYVCIYVYISDIHNLFHVAFGVCYVIGSNSKMLWFQESWVTNNSR
jgi:cytochrome bd-type quinol oxidase subunit 1